MTALGFLKCAGWGLWFMALGAGMVCCVQRGWYFVVLLLVLLLFVLPLLKFTFHAFVLFELFCVADQ